MKRFVGRIEFFYLHDGVLLILGVFLREQFELDLKLFLVIPKLMYFLGDGLFFMMDLSNELLEFHFLDIG